VWGGRALGWFAGMTGCSGEKSDWQQRVATADRN